MIHYTSLTLYEKSIMFFVTIDDYISFIYQVKQLFTNPSRVKFALNGGHCYFFYSNSHAKCKIFFLKTLTFKQILYLIQL